MNKKGKNTIINTIIICMLFTSLILTISYINIPNKNIYHEFCEEQNYTEYNDFIYKKNYTHVECINKETGETKIFYNLTLEKECIKYDKWNLCEKHRFKMIKESEK